MGKDNLAKQLLAERRITNQLLAELVLKDTDKFEQEFAELYDSFIDGKHRTDDKFFFDVIALHKKYRIEESL